MAPQESPTAPIASWSQLQIQLGRARRALDFPAYLDRKRALDRQSV